MSYVYLVKQLWKYAGTERWKIVTYYLLHAASVLGDLGKPYAFAMVLNALQVHQATMMSDIFHWLKVYLLCFVTFEGCHRAARYIEIPVAFRARRRFTDAIYNKLQSLPLSWHTEHHSGNLINRANTAASALQQFGVSQSQYVSVIMKFWGPLIVLWSMSPSVAVAALASGSLMMIISRRAYDSIVPLYREQLETLHDFSSAFFDYMTNMKTIITLRLGQYAKKDLDNRLGRVFPLVMQENNVTHLKCFSIAVLQVLLEVGVIFYYISAHTHVGVVVKVGTVTAIFAYLGQLMGSFQFYVFDYEGLIHSQSDFEAANPIFEAAGLRSDNNTVTLLEWEEIAVNPITFSYNSEKLHLNNVAVKLQRRNKIALVGESGSGKSTLLQALRGLSDIPDASIVIDRGKKEVPLSALASTTTLIQQEPEIFENTVLHNITMGIPASDAEVQASMRVAAFDIVAAGLANGLETDIREKGVNLSGGEKQRLSLARGVFSIRDSSIILLDEPTSNVDPSTEATIFDRFFSTFADHCIVASIHRLHLVRRFDYVYVMKQGSVVEEGTFDGLVTGNGEFARLWAKYEVESDKQDEAAECTHLSTG